MLKNKIAIIDHVGDKSGMDFYDISLANELGKLVEVSIFSNFESTHRANKGVFIEKVFLKKKDKESKLDKIKYFFSGFLKAYKLAKKQKIKNILFHSFSYEIKDVIIYLLARLFGFKIYLVAHDVSGFANSDNQIIKKITLKHLAYKVLVHNEFSKKELLKSLALENKIITIRHGGFIDQVDSSLDKEQALLELGLSSENKYVLFFGQIKEVKGLDLLIEAFSKIEDKNVKLIIAGKVWKDTFSTYEDLIAQHNLSDKIILHQRFIPDNEKDLFFTIADLVVIPYKKIYQSGVLLTSLSYPAITLCSDLEPNREVINDEINGFLFESNNSRSLSQKINYILKLNTNTLSEIKQNALKTVKEDFNWEYPAIEIFKNL